MTQDTRGRSLSTPKQMTSLAWVLTCTAAWAIRSSTRPPRGPERRRKGFVCQNWQIRQEIQAMAKATTIKIKLVSSAGTGYYYVTKKNTRNITGKLVKRKYDPVVRKHVEFREAKIK